MKICLIGVGNMGKAIADNLNDDFGSDNVILCDKNILARDCFSSNKKISDICELDDEIDCFILCVKPQSFDDLSIELKNRVNKDALIISVMAGMDIPYVRGKLEHENIIRIMPNLTIVKKKGVIGYFAEDEVLNNFEEEIKKIIGSWGKVFLMEDEDQLDKITAISGSGPAYFYFLCKAMQQSAVKMGINEEIAKGIARGTLVGAGFMQEDMNTDIDEEIKKVASKGGTTEAAINYLNDKDFCRIINEAIDSAYKQSKKLK